MSLYTPVRMAGLGQVKNRFALAPMTRSRATPGGIVGAHHVEYYTQRSTAGIVVSEGTIISPDANGWFCAPGIWTKEQTEAWTAVPKAVQAEGSKFIMQLWHCGRASHPDFHDGKLPYGASPLAITSGGVRVPPDSARKDYVAPRELPVDEVPGLLEEFRVAARNAKAAGVDGVEIHSANGYLIDSFLQTVSNQRTDKYGGSVENRLRLMNEVISAVLEVFPADRVGIRFSPNGNFNSMGSKDYVEAFDAAIKDCAKKELGYIHVMDGLGFGFHELGPPYTLSMAKAAIEGVQGKGEKRVTMIMGNCGHTKESAEAEVSAGNCEMIAFGRPYIGNPDLPRRFKEDIPLTETERSDWYEPLAEDPTQGYTTFLAAE